MFIINPKAGGLRHKDKLDTFHKLIRSNFSDAKFLLIDDNNMHLISSENLQQYNAVVACGGDGTIQMTAEKIMGTSTPLGIIPMGSGNDFVKSAGISRRPERALKQLLKSNPQPVDVIQYETNTIKRICINTLGIGFDGLVNYLRTQNNKKGYIGPVLKAAFSQRSFYADLKIDGKSVNKHFLMITLANGHTEGGNFKLVTNSSISDGYFELITIEPLSKPGLLLRLPLFLFGLQHYSKKIKTIKAKSVEIVHQKPVYAHVDGEQLGQIRSLNAEILPGKLQLLIPNE